MSRFQYSIFLLLALSLVAVALVGCAGNDMMFYRPDMTAKLYHKDVYECERDMRQVRYNQYEDPFPFAVRCMQARGWMYVSASTITTQARDRVRAQWNDQ